MVLYWLASDSTNISLGLALSTEIHDASKIQHDNDMMLSQALYKKKVINLWEPYQIPVIEQFIKIIFLLLSLIPGMS